KFRAIGQDCADGSARNQHFAIIQQSRGVRMARRIEGARIDPGRGVRCLCAQQYQHEQRNRMLCPETRSRFHFMSSTEPVLTRGSQLKGCQSRGRDSHGVLIARKNFCPESPESVKSALPNTFVTPPESLQFERLVEVRMV